MHLARSLAAGEPLPVDPPPHPRAESMGDLFFRAEGGARDIVGSEVKLVSFPDIYFKIRQILDSPTSSAAQVADVISKDTSLTAKLLKLVNSPFYGLPQRIDSISRAVMVIGPSGSISVQRFSASLSRIQRSPSRNQLSDIVDQSTRGICHATAAGVRL